MPPSPVVADEEVLPIQIVDLFSSRDLARPGGPPSCEGVSAHEYYHAWSWFSQSHSPLWVGRDLPANTSLLIGEHAAHLCPWNRLTEGSELFHKGHGHGNRGHFGPTTPPVCKPLWRAERRRFDS
jgi:hypothetical protein